MLKRLLFLSITATAFNFNLFGADAQSASDDTATNQVDYSLLDQPAPQEEHGNNEQATVIEPTDIVQPIEDAPDADAGV
jgi:hypothetical protein